MRNPTSDARSVDLIAPRVGPQVDAVVKAKFDRIDLGMSLKEVEAILGPAGPSYSSDTERDYYIWKTKNDWISVIMEQGKVTSKQVRRVATSKE